MNELKNILELKNEDASICQQTQEPHGHDDTYRHRDQLGLGGTLLATTEETGPSNILGDSMTAPELLRQQMPMVRPSGRSL